MVGQQEGRHELRLTPAGRGEHRGTPYFHPSILRVALSAYRLGNGHPSGHA